MDYYIYILAFFGLFFIINYILIMRQMLGLVLQYPYLSLKLPEEVPEYFLPIFDLASTELTPLGFKPFCYLTGKTYILDYGLIWWFVLYNETENIFAKIYPDPDFTYRVTFETFFWDGSSLITYNCFQHQLIAPIPKAIIQDPYSANLNEHYQYHCQTLKTLTQERLISPSPETILSLIIEKEKLMIDSQLVKHKLIRLADGNSFKFTFLKAIEHSIQLQKGFSKIKQIKSRVKKIEIPLEMEVEQYQRSTRFYNRPVSKTILIWVFLITFLLSILVFYQFFNLLEIIVLIITILIHELGHFLAMKYFGYQNTSIFFIPLFGAAATGSKEKISLFEEIIVLFAGPIPGIFLVLLISIIWGEQLKPFADLLLLSIIINYLNLLPILPFDGGKIINLLVFSINPFFNIIFKFFSLGLLAFTGISFNEPMLLFLSYIIASGLPRNFQLVKINKRLSKPELIEKETPEQLKAIFKALNLAGYQNLSFAQKYSLVKEIKEGLLVSNNTVRFFFILLYIGFLIGGFLLIMLLFVD